MRSDWPNPVGEAFELDGGGLDSEGVGGGMGWWMALDIPSPVFWFF